MCCSSVNVKRSLESVDQIIFLPSELFERLEQRKSSQRMFQLKNKSLRAVVATAAVVVATAAVVVAVVVVVVIAAAAVAAAFVVDFGNGLNSTIHSESERSVFK